MSPGKTFLASLFMFLFLRFCNSIDTITLTRPVNDGDILVSSGESFALGFFSPTNSSNRYVGIWYNKIPEQTVVWVANRDNPISHSSGVLSVDETGNIVLHERGQTIAYWSSNISAVVNGDFSAQLLDTGNLVLFQGQNRQVFLWQSFDHPTNTFLPEMKCGLDRKTGLNRFYTSWKSSENPGTGQFSYKMEVVGSAQLFLYHGMKRVMRTGSWTGSGWSGVPQMRRTYMIFDVSFIDNNDEVVVIDHVPNSTTFSRLVVNESGIIERMTWEEANLRWNVYLSAPIERCDRYSNCGPFGYCDPNESNGIDCKCFPGYEPRLPQDWELWDGSKGCTRKPTTRMCEDGDDFIELPFSKVPDTSVARVDMSIGLEACKALCLKNCSCVGYATADISGAGRGCITWHGELIDTRTYLSGGQSFYVRVDAAEFAKNSLKNQKSSHKNRFIVIGIPMIAVGFLISACIFYYIKKKRTNRREHEAEFIFKSSKAFQGSFLKKDIGENVDIHVFDLSTIVAATANFSTSNKLGEGGFGSVYKGKLLNGNEIAAKRLSQSSGQGMEEFKNEVTLIAKLQHRNLVRLLGYCFQKEERMLIYEYLPNKGLDSFIFDQEKGSILDWKKRFQIILGIVRGLLYLHQDSRLKIIHRDLKASNVLLDAALNPKISDFGLAKIFGGDQDEAKTRRVVGTYGYMSPEYAMEGLFSVKSDVYSFGVLVLEIISGRKNTSYHMEKSLNLIGHVWDLWKQDRALSVVDSSLGNEYDACEVLLCIHVGILCLQESANDRPTMTNVASMLTNHETKLSSPNQPAFIFRQSNYATDPTSASASTGVCSVVDDTITIIQARYLLRVGAGTLSPQESSNICFFMPLHIRCYHKSICIVVVRATVVRHI